MPKRIPPAPPMPERRNGFDTDPDPILPLATDEDEKTPVGHKANRIVAYWLADLSNQCGSFQQKLADLARTTLHDPVPLQPARIEIMGAALREIGRDFVKHADNVLELSPIPAGE